MEAGAASACQGEATWVRRSCCAVLHLSSWQPLETPRGLTDYTSREPRHRPP